MSVNPESPEGAELPKVRALGSGAGGPVRRKLHAALVEARRAGRMTSEHEVLALLAARYADLVDRAAQADDGRALLQAGDKLLELMRRLPIRVEGSGGGGSGGGDGGRGGFLSVVDGAPEVGNAADA